MIITFETTMTHNLSVEVDLPADATEDEVREYLLKEDPDIISVESPTTKAVMKNAWCELEYGTQLGIDAESTLSEEELIAKQENNLPITCYYS